MRCLQDILMSCNPQVVGLLETKLNHLRSEVLRCKLGFEGCFAVNSRGRSGGLILFWRKGIDVTIVNYSRYHISGVVEFPNYDPFQLTLFYGHPSRHLRYQSLNLLRNLNSTTQLPWVVMGDFNEIMFRYEANKISSSRDPYIYQFRNAVSDCNLRSVPFTGNQFTYSNRRRGSDEYKARLDRCLVSQGFQDLFVKFKVTHIFSYLSDHLPLLFSIMPFRFPGTKNFQFEATWLSSQRFKASVDRFWNHNLNDSNTNLYDKLLVLRSFMLDWQTKNFGPIKKTI